MKDFQLKLNIDQTIQPVVQKVRNTTFHVRKHAEQKIEELIREDIIEEVKGPTPWVSPIVIAHKKDGDIRICTDMRHANRAIKRSHFHIPTVEEVLQFAQGAKFFSQIDLKWGYHQIELEPSSRYITAFVCHCKR